MKRTNTTQLENAVWANFNMAALAAASAHLPHDTAAYERARDIAQHRAERLVDEIRKQARENDALADGLANALESPKFESLVKRAWDRHPNNPKNKRAREWRQPDSLVPFDSELS